MSVRRKMAFCASLAFTGLVVGGSGAYASLDGPRRDPAAVESNDPLTWLGLRSPGGRLGQFLLQSKQARLAKVEAPPPLGGGQPQERVLPLVRLRPPSSGELNPSELAEGLGDAGIAPGAGGLDFPAAALEDSPYTMAGSFFPPFPLSSGPWERLITGLPGVLPPLEGPGGAPPLIEGPLTGVPEPGAWSMMIVGLFAVGGLMRRRCAAGLRDVKSA